jgi:hypothetical protein
MLARPSPTLGLLSHLQKVLAGVCSITLRHFASPIPGPAVNYANEVAHLPDWLQTIGLISVISVALNSPKQFPNAGSTVKCGQLPDGREHRD